jgi:hypothetical protein
MVFSKAFGAFLEFLHYLHLDLSLLYSVSNVCGRYVEYRDYFDTGFLVLLDYVEDRSGGVVLRRRRVGMMLLCSRIRRNTCHDSTPYVHSNNNRVSP